MFVMALKNGERKMNQFVPKLFDCMKSYTKEQFAKDVISGIIVAIIALPLSIALALASGVGPEQGIYTAIFAGFVISFLGGSNVQIAGPTAAFATIVAGIVARNGMSGLAAATIMAGILLIIMGFLKLGNLIRFIPYTITTGFTFGIAVTILVGQIKDFLGLTFTNSPIDTVDKVKECINCIGTFNYQALIVGVVALAILIIFPKITEKIPPSLIAVIVTIVMVKVLKMDVKTIGDLYTISNKLPSVSLPSINFTMIRELFPDALTIAVLAGIESLLSCVVADGMVGSRHKPNMELVAQGAGNVVSALFGGIPATGAIARTAANIKSGGRTPVAGIIHAIVLLLILLFLGPLTKHIPMACLAGVLIIVSYNMSEWRTFRSLMKNPKSDVSVLLVTFFLTVIFDLTIAIEIGLLIAMLFFMRRVAETTHVSVTTDEIDLSDEGEIHHDEEVLSLPKGVEVYEIDGPFFFGVANKFDGIMKSMGDKPKVRIIRMRKVSFIDSTGLHNLESLFRLSEAEHIHMILSGVNEHVHRVLTKSGFDKKIGAENICSNINEAVEKAKAAVQD